MSLVPRSARLALGALLGLLLTLAPAALAHAEGKPNIALGVEAPASLLYGANATVTLTASNPSGQPYGYNLSYRAVLPSGISYVAGSTHVGGATAAEPKAIANEPKTGETTLIWSNVGDLSPASHNTLTFEVSHSTSTYSVGSSYTVQAGAYIASEPRYLPKFSATGKPEGPLPTSYTGSATGSASTMLSALEITQSEPDGALLRGVHDHQVLYKIMVSDTKVNSTGNVVVGEWLPADLEYLGCGGTDVDNTTDVPTNPGSTEEYPGSGPIDVAPLSGCVAPALVETVDTDPDGSGPEPTGVYTHVTYDLGTLAAGETRTLEFRAAVPQYENTTTWTGTEPTAASGKQAVNLDNNSGAETHDGESVQTYAQAKGEYAGTTPVSAENHLTRVAKDIVIEKSASSETLAEGQVTLWTLHISSSEYRYNTGVVVTDTVPNGLCPLDSTNLTSSSECEPTGKPEDVPSSPYATAVENENGTWTLVWNEATDPALKLVEQNGTTTITYATRTRTHYQSDHTAAGPILANDTVTNAALAQGTANIVCDGDTDCSGGGEKPIGHERTGEVVSASASATQSAAGPTISKTIAKSGTECLSDEYTESVPVYHPGDLVCWRLTASFPTATNTKGLQVTDFLPFSVEFDSAFNSGKGEAATAADTLPGTTFDDSEASSSEPGGVLTWTLPESGVVKNEGQRFQRVYATTAILPKGAVPGDLQGNLMKFANVNTPGESFAQRAEADFKLQFPQLSLTKDVTEVAGKSITPTTSATVKGGQEATFELKISNAGELAAGGVEVWEELPEGLSCASVVSASISNKGACLSNRITWGETGIGEEEVTVAALGHTSLHFTVKVPAQIDPATMLEDHAGVREYDSPTNQGTLYRYIPENNIDPTLAAETNAAEANAHAALKTEEVTLKKTHTSALVETGNSTTQATIGEQLTFEVTATIPAGTTLSGVAKLTDTEVPSTRLSYEAGSVEALVDGATAPGTFKVEEPSGSPVVVLPENYEAPATTSVTVTMRFHAHVTNVAANVHGSEIPNTGKLAWTNPISGPQTREAKDKVPLVEPAISLSESNNAGGKPVHGGQLVEYTIKLKNASTASTAFGNTVVDTIPSGLIPSNSKGEPLAEGETTADGGVWSAANHTITWTLESLATNSEHSFSYFATVQEEPVSASNLTDKVHATTESLPSHNSLARTAANATASKTSYEASTKSELEVQAAAIEKTSDSSEATIGHRITYTLTVTLPAHVIAYDETVIDTLPDSLDFDEYVSATCTSGCPPEAAPEVKTYKPEIASSGTTVAWYFGNLGSTSVARTIKLVYRASVRATHRSGGSPIDAPYKIENTAGVYYDQSAKKTFEKEHIPATGSFDKEVSATPTATTVVEPSLTLVKEASVDGGPYSTANPDVTDGATIDYRLRVANKGTSPAYDVAVSDKPPSALVDVSTVANAAATVTKAWSEASPEIAWKIAGPLEPKGEVTLEYKTKLRPVAELKAGQQIANDATVPSYFGVSESERTEGLENYAGEAILYREYKGPSAQITATLQLPSIAIEKTTTASGFPTSGTAEVGQAFGWRVVVKNTSSVPAKNLKVIDTLPANWEYVSGSASFAPGGSATPSASGALASGEILTWETSIELAAGQSTVLTYEAKPTVAAETIPGTGVGHPNVNEAEAFVQDSAGNSGDSEGPFASGSAQAHATLIIPGLQISKTPTKATVAAGEGDSYEVVVHNAGAGVAREVIVADTLPTGMTYAAGKATASPSTGFSEQSASSSAVSWKIEEIQPGASVTITVPVGTEASLASGTELVNEVATHSVEQPTPVSAQGKIDITTSADLKAEKSVLGGGPAVPGRHLTYVLGTTNKGPSVARAVKLTDQLPAGLTYVSAESGCSESSGTVTCEAAELRPGDSVSFDVLVAVASNVTGTIANTVRVESSTPDPEPANNEATVEVPAAPEADLKLVKTALTPEVLDGQQATFALAVSNEGPSDAAAAQIVDTLPAGLSYVGSSGATCTAVNQEVTCPLGALAAGADRTVEITVLTSGVGTDVNKATVSSATTDPEPANNSSEASVKVLPAADLSLSKTASPTTVELPGEVTYTLTVENHGPDAAQEVKLTDPLPAGETYLSDDAGCKVSGQTVTCELGELADEASRTVHLHVQVGVILGERIVTNTAEVTSPTGDPEPHNNIASAPITTGPAADVALSKTGPTSVVSGSQIVWTLVATDHGPSTAHEVTVVDPLPAGVSYVSASPSQGVCAYEAGTLTCHLGTLANGASAQIALAATVTMTSGTLANTAHVSAHEPDPEPANNSATASTEVTALPPASAPTSTTPSTTGGPTSPKSSNSPGSPPRVSVTLHKVSPEPGRAGVLRYHLTVRNTGSGTAKQLVVCDQLPEQTSVLSSGGGRIAQGEICFKIASLAPGHSRTFTVVLRAEPGARGRIVNRASVTGANFKRARTRTSTPVSRAHVAPHRENRVTG